MVNRNLTQQLVQKYFSITDASGFSITPEIHVDQTVNLKTLGWLAQIKPTPQIPVQFGHVNDTFSAQHMTLTTLKGVPHTCDYLLVNNNHIKNLDHCTPHLKWLSVKHNKLTNLKGDLKQAHVLDVRDNPLISLEGLEHMKVDVIRLTYDAHLPLLRLLLVPVLELWSHDDPHAHHVHEILDKYKGQGKRAMLNCALELKTAGFEGNARW